MTRVTDQVKTNMQLFLQKIGCIDYDYFGKRCLVSVKRKEAAD